MPLHPGKVRAVPWPSGDFPAIHVPPITDSYERAGRNAGTVSPQRGSYGEDAGVVSNGKTPPYSCVGLAYFLDGTVKFTGMMTQGRTQFDRLQAMVPSGVTAVQDTTDKRA